MRERYGPRMLKPSAIEQQIAEAIEAGEFDDLAGAGKPIDALDRPYDELWWVRDKLRRERLSSLPPALELKRWVEERLDRLLRSSSEAHVRREVAELNDNIRAANRTTTRGPATSLMPLHAEQVVRRWRARRGNSAE